jgi:dienelactone hydrolase
MTKLEPIPYSDRSTALTGWLARPAGRPRTAIAVFPTIMNITPVIEAKALALAEAGYLAFVADFYGQPVPDFGTSQALSKVLVSESEHFRQRLHAALVAMRSLNGAGNLPQAAIGFCMGGQAVLELARADADLAMVASFHGILETTQPATKPIRPRILVCHGDADRLVPRSHVLAFWEEMDTVQADWHFHSYSGVPHGFTNPNPSPMTGAIAYNASADRHSWAALLRMLDEVLR